MSTKPIRPFKLVVKRSPIAGRGVFTTQPFRKGQRIHVMGGRRMTILEMFEAVDSGLENGSDPLLVGPDLYLDLDELSRTFNHSCNPNAYLQGRCTLVAIRNIRAGDEITYDYSTTMIDGKRIESLGHRAWWCRCKCGARNCVGRIDQFERLPTRRQAYYLRNRYAPDFVLGKFMRR